MDKADRLCRRFERLKADRGVWEDHWQDVAEHIFPRRADFSLQRSPGDRRMRRIVDATGLHALELLAAGLHGLATNPAARWFSLRLRDDVLSAGQEARTYLSAVEDAMFAAMHAPRAGLATHLHELYLDLAAFGTAVLFVGEGAGGELLFQTRPLSECAIDENMEGQVDTVIRCFSFTIRQAHQQWGERCSPEVLKKHAEGRFDDRIEILHAVFPRADMERVPGKATPDAMPYASLYLEKEARHLLQEGGFEEFPYCVPRWYKTANEKYGRSPAMSALPDVKMLQEMARTTLKAAQKIVDPPLLVPDDGMIGPVRTVPGGLNFYRGEREITPLQTGGNIPVSLEMMQDLRARIQTMFFVDQLQFAGSADMTATEVMQRTQEKMRLLGPIMGRLESELLGPLISRVFAILSRGGRLPAQPAELDGKTFDIEYVSPIALAQKGQKVERALQMLTISGQLAGADPAVMARFDGAGFMPWLARELGVDPDIILDDEEMAAKQQTQMALMAAGPAEQAASAFLKAGQGAKAFAEAGVEPSARAIT